MSQPERRELSTLSIPDLADQIRNQTTSLRGEGLLPNGLQQLVIGSAQYRPPTTFNESGANEGLYFGDEGFNERYADWLKTYDPFSGENLMGTAAYQHRRYKPEDARFPAEGSEEYLRATARMGELGAFLRELNGRVDGRELNRILYELGKRAELI